MRHISTDFERFQKYKIDLLTEMVLNWQLLAEKKKYLKGHQILRNHSNLEESKGQEETKKSMYFELNDNGN